MALFGFEFTYTDEKLGKPVFFDVSCEIEIDREPGLFVVAGAYLDGASDVPARERQAFNMHLGTPLTASIATAAMEAAERELDSQCGYFYGQVTQHFEEEMRDAADYAAEDRAEYYSSMRERI